MTVNTLAPTYETIDIHGLTACAAKRQLERFITTAIPNLELTVIHGHSHGKELLNMVRFKLKHKRIARKVLSLNQGITILIIK